MTQEQLDHILAQIAGASSRKIESVYPLTPSQQGMFFESLFAPTSGIHIEQSIWRLQDGLNMAAFERAWQRIIQRHPVLRTGFLWQGLDEPLQVVLHAVGIPSELQDWRGLSPSQQETALAAYVETDRRRGFDLACAPLMRLAIFRTDESAHYIAWTHHHILMDGWCMNLIAKELLTLLEAYTHGHDVILKPSRPYRDYIRWLRQQDLSQAAAFWRQALQGFRRPTPLGKTAEPMTCHGQRYAKQVARLSPAATRRLRSLVREHHITESTLIQGSWALLLSRYSGHSDVVFGATVSGRPPELVDVESMVGLFINTLPMRFVIEPGASLWSWLEKTQARHLEQHKYEYCSTGQIHQWTEAPDSLPLYESIVVFENYPVDADALRSSVSIIDVSNNNVTGAQTHYALVLLVSPDTELGFEIVYDGYRFTSADVARILAHLLTLLETLAAVPEPSLAQLIEAIPVDQIPHVKAPAAQQALRAGIVPPRDNWELQLARIWESLLDVRPVGVYDNFFELGGHSLVAVRLMAQIQQAFGRHLPLALLFQAPTIEQLATLLREQTDVASWSSLVPIQPGGSAPPLFCVPGGGGNVLYFHALVQHLGPEQPFYGLQAQGLDGESAPHTRVEDMAAYYIEAIQAVKPQGPYLLGGHSFGGWIAFEMAQQLRKRGHEVARLFILDTPAPVFAGTPIPDDADDDVAVMVTIARLAERLFGQSLGVTHTELQALDWEAQLHYLNERFQAANLLPRGGGVHQVSGLVQVFRAVSRIQYLPREAQLTPITLLRASESNSEDAFNDSLALPQDPTWGWSRFAAGRVEVHTVPGDHITMMAEPHVRGLAERLSACLAQVSHAASVAAGWK